MFDPYDDAPHYFPAKILGDSDVVIRIGPDSDPTYQHHRFGRYENTPNTEPMWHPIGNLFGNDAGNPRQVIIDAGFKANEENKANVVLPIKATINRIKST